MKAWHFSNGMTLRDGQELIEGKTYIYEGEIKICKSGYHASKNVLDALRYAPGFTLSLVDCEGIVEEHEDKFVCSSRKVLKILDVKKLILMWTADVAEDALKNVKNPDERLIDAIKAIRDFMNGKISQEEMKKAASNAYDAWCAYANYYADCDDVRAASNAYDAWCAYANYYADCGDDVRAAARASYYAASYAARDDVRAFYYADDTIISAKEKYYLWLSERIEKEFVLS